MPLMEAPDLVERITEIGRMQRIGCTITTSARRWHTRSVLHQARLNAQLRRDWARGEALDLLVKRYDS